MRLIPRSRLKEEKGIVYSYDWLCELERKGLFPKSIRVGRNRRAYIEEEIDAWIKEKADSRDKVA